MNEDGFWTRKALWHDALKNMKQGCGYIAVGVFSSVGLSQHQKIKPEMREDHC